MRRKLMRKLLSGICATTLAASFAIASAVPVNAAPVFVPQAPAAKSDIIQVQSDDRMWRKLRREFRREARRDRRDRREFRRDFRRDRDDRYGWYRGHRGYRDYRPGYRRHGDFWFPLAAFAAGAIISGALSSPPRRVYAGNAHVQWCYDRWRSYRAYDNTYQPYNGPRRQCISPYS
jgi:hypothetical protein